MTRLATVSLAAVLSLGLPLPALAGSIGDEVKLNPQPLPPKEGTITDSVTNHDAVMLNPQPLPPKEGAISDSVTNHDAVMLNPQPLPPKEVPGSHVLLKHAQ